MEPIWIIYLEVLAFLDSAPAVGKLGFINVVLSAADAFSAESKVRKVLAEYAWQTIGVEDISMFNVDHVYHEEIAELVDDVIANPHCVRLATLHTYKSN